MTSYGAAGDDEARFLSELRQLRDGAGLGQAELAARAHYPFDSIRAAEVGPDLPDLPVLAAYVKGCGGTTEEWEERWRSLTRSPSLPVPAARLVGDSPAASAGARIGSTALDAEPPDPSIIIAALNRVAEEMASGSGDPLAEDADASPWSGLASEASPAVPATAVEPAPANNDLPAGWDPIRVSSAWPVLPLSPGDAQAAGDVSRLPATPWERAPWESAPWAEDPAGAAVAQAAAEAPVGGRADSAFTVENKPPVPAAAPSAGAVPSGRAAQPAAAALPGGRAAQPAAAPAPASASERPAGASRARLLVACAVLLCVIAVALAIFV